MNNTFLQFDTDRLILKPTDVTDASFILELYNTPKWLQFIGDRNIHSEADAATYIQEKMLPQFLRLGFGNYTIIEKESNIKIGLCGLYDREGIEGIDLGFAFLPNFEGKGYGFECARRLIEASKEDFDLKELCAITNEDNESSQKLLLKLGFVYNKTVEIRKGDFVKYFILKLN